MKFLVDMNLSPRWVGYLREHGFEATHWSTVGPADATDSMLMQLADQHEHLVLTNDLDFGALLAATQRLRPSVLQIGGAALAPESIGAAVLACVQQTQAELLSGALVSLEAERMRVRLLPF